MEILQGVRKVPCIGCYLGNVGSLFHANVGNLLDKSAKITVLSKIRKDQPLVS